MIKDSRTFVDCNKVYCYTQSVANSKFLVKSADLCGHCVFVCYR